MRCHIEVDKAPAAVLLYAKAQKARCEGPTDQVIGFLALNQHVASKAVGMTARRRLFQFRRMQRAPIATGDPHGLAVGIAQGLQSVQEPYIHIALPAVRAGELFVVE